MGTVSVPSNRRFPVAKSLIVLGAIGALALAYRHFDAPAQPTAATSPQTAAPQAVAPAAPAMPPVPITVGTVERRDLPLFVSGLGNVQAYMQTTVRTQVDGQLIKVLFREGQDVQVGDPVAEIDPRIYQAALDQAVAKKAQDEAQLANARLDEKRYQELVDRNYISRQQLDTTHAQVAQFEAAVKGDAAAIDNARVLLGYTTIRAPIPGRIGLRLVDPGNIVHAAESGAIAVITQLHPIAVIFTLPEAEVSRVLAAQGTGHLPVTILSRDGGTVLDEGQLELVDNQIDPATAMAKLKAIVPNKSGLLWPGEFVNARLSVGSAKGVVAVPLSAVLQSQQGSYCWVVKADGTAEIRSLETGTREGGWVVVKSGLAEGETVVTSGHFRLQPGSTVEIREAKAGSTP